MVHGGYSSHMVGGTRIVLEFHDAPWPKKMKREVLEVIEHSSRDWLELDADRCDIIHLFIDEVGIRLVPVKNDVVWPHKFGVKIWGRAYSPGLPGRRFGFRLKRWKRLDGHERDDETGSDGTRYDDPGRGGDPRPGMQYR